MKIIDNITTRNYTKGNNRSIKYIVIHYVGAVSSAKNNSIYFKNTYRGASAHYFVDENDIYRVVEDKNIAWHCGTTGKYYHSTCRNSNSIGVEMCCYKKNGKIDVSDKVVERTIELVKGLMSRYNIPTSNVIRHYDVTHKNCPAPFVSDHSRWDNFKAKLNSKNSYTPSIYYKACSSKYNSISDALKSIGVDGSYSYRKKIAQKNGIRNYSGTANQNIELLNKLKQGKLIKV